MPLDQLKEKLLQLPEEEQREVITFLFSRLAEVDDDFKDFDPKEDDDEHPADGGEFSEIERKGGGVGFPPCSSPALARNPSG